MSSQPSHRRWLIGLTGLVTACIALAAIWQQYPPTQAAAPETATTDTSAEMVPGPASDRSVGFTPSAGGFAGETAGLQVETDDGRLQVRRDDGLGSETFTFSGLGRGGDLQQVPSGLSYSDFPQAVDTLASGMTKRTVLRDDGVAHGLWLHERPSGDGELAIAVDLAGGLSAELAHAGQSILLHDETGETRLSLAAPGVYDASGRRLSNSMQLVDGQARLMIDDAGARYPLYVEPVVRRVDPMDTRASTTLKKVSVFVESLEYTVDGEVRGWFGYYNPNSVTVSIPVGPDNRFSPNPKDRGQVTEFEPGPKFEAFYVDMSTVSPGSNLVWIVNGKTTTFANPSSPFILDMALCINEEVSDTTALAKNGHQRRLGYEVTNNHATKTVQGIDPATRDLKELARKAQGPVDLSFAPDIWKTLEESRFSADGVEVSNIVDPAWNFFWAIDDKGGPNKWDQASQIDHDQDHPLFFPMWSTTSFETVVPFDNQIEVYWFLNGDTLLVDKNTPTSTTTSN